MIIIAYIKFTPLLLSKNLSETLLKINNHYALIIKNKFFVLSTSPSKYLISEQTINSKIHRKQYLWEQCYQFDARVVELVRMRHADEYLIDHIEKFKYVLTELDINNIINLVTIA